jgi:Putative MetA-pathway of phenol degradation
MQTITIARNASLVLSVFPVLSVLAVSATARANHGPGTSGGGLTTISGETVKASTWDMSFRLDFTNYDGLTVAQAEAHAANSGGFDSIESSTLASYSLTYGVTDDFQLSATIGWYWGNDFIDAEDIGGGVIESATADPSGLTDMWITGKYRVMKGEEGHLALLGGIKLPTGRDDERLSNGELLEPSSQPGSGSYDFMGGVAYSRFLTSHLTLDASVSYILRTEAHDYRVGDRFDADLAVAWRLTDDIRSMPNISLFGELAWTTLLKDHADGVANPNSGGNTLYLAPGVRARFSPSTALTVSPQFPVLQQLDGDQVETEYKLTAMLSIAF